MYETNKMTHEQMNELLRQQDAGLATLRKKLATAEAELKKCGEAVMTYVETVKRKNRDIWAAEADCAALREALEFYGSQKFFAVMPDDGKTRVVPICNEDGSFAHYLAFVNDDGEIARAALTRPTGQAIMDELSAARELIEAQSEDRAAYNPEPWKEEQHLRMQKAEERLSKAEERYDAARKANT